MNGCVFRNSNGSLYFTEYGNHATKNLEKGKWIMGKGAHALSINPGTFPEVKWEDDKPTPVDMSIAKQKIDKQTIENIIELFISWNGESEPIDTANLKYAVDYVEECLNS
jgi:hypothetical protein